MKSLYNKDNRLESHRFFPYVAWFLVLSFAYAVFTFVVDFRETTKELSQKTNSLQAKSSMDITDIEDFSR